MKVEGQRSVGSLVRDLHAASSVIRTGGVISKNARLAHCDLLSQAVQALTELAHRLREAELSQPKPGERLGLNVSDFPNKNPL